MNMELKSGMTAPYFITDPARSLGIVSAPCNIVVVARLGLDALADSLSWLVARKPEAQDFRWFRKEKPKPPPREPETREACRKQLRADFEEIVKGQPGFSHGYDHPVVFLTERIEQDALVATTVLKLRGMGQMLAVELPPNEQPFDVFARHAGEFLRTGLNVEAARCGLWIYHFPTAMTIVSGLHKTVISREMTIEQIVNAHPDLAGPHASTLDMRSPAAS